MPLAPPCFRGIVTHKSRKVTTNFAIQFPKILMTFVGHFQLRILCENPPMLCSVPAGHHQLFISAYTQKLASYSSYNSTSPKAKNSYYSSHCFPNLSNHYSNTLFLKVWWKVSRNGLSFLLNGCFCQPSKTSKKYKAGVTESIVRLTVWQQLLLGMTYNIYFVSNN